MSWYFSSQKGKIVFLFPRVLRTGDSHRRYFPVLCVFYSIFPRVKNICPRLLLFTENLFSIVLVPRYKDTKYSQNTYKLWIICSELEIFFTEPLLIPWFLYFFLLANVMPALVATHANKQLNCPQKVVIFQAQSRVSNPEPPVCKT